MRVPTIAELLGCGASEPEAVRLQAAVQHFRGSPHDVWKRVSQELLLPDHPFALHQMLAKCIHAHAFTVVDTAGYPPMWIPSVEGAAQTNVARFMKTFKGDSYWQRNRSGDPRKDFPYLQMSSFDSPEEFWPSILQELKISFTTPPTRMLEGTADKPDEVRWLPNATMNIAESCVTGRDPDASAVIWAEEGSPTDVRSISFAKLRQQICAVAASLRQLGCERGEAVAICMPMTAQTVSVYLGIVWAGCCVVGIADSFSKDAIAARVKVSNATCMFTQDIISRGGKTLPLYERLAGIDLARGSIVLPAQAVKGVQVELRSRDRTWAQFQAADPSMGLDLQPPHVSDAYSVTNILFSSGTTGEPKAIPWTHVTPIRCAVDAWAHQDVRTNDVVVWPTNLGWMMGPWLIYAALLNGAAIGLYQGSPLGREFGQFVASARVTMLGLVPSIAKVWRASGCLKGLDWGSIRCFSSSGEASSSDDYHWLMARAGYKPVIEYCGGTEIGGGFLAGSMLLPNRPSAFATPTLGSRIVILCDESGLEQSPHSPLASPAAGELAILPPMLGSSQRLLNRDHYKVYFAGMPRIYPSGPVLRRHGDTVARLTAGVYCARGRSDDTMNLGGIKVSSVEIERACMAANLPGVLELAAIGVSPPNGGPERLLIFFVTVSGWNGQPDAAAASFSKSIKEKLNPLFKVSSAIKVEALPRTASNKVMRRVLRDMVVQQVDRPTPRL